MFRFPSKRAASQSRGEDAGKRSEYGRPPNPLFTSRVRGAKLQRLRISYLTRNPLCAICKSEGRIRAAEVLDHIVSLNNGGLDFDEDQGTNRQGLCVECHVKKTRRDMGYADTPRPKRIGIDGYPIGEENDD
jgi:5-methylcytosine-specific restriction endonuclease McrA